MVVHTMVWQATLCLRKPLLSFRVNQLPGPSEDFGRIFQEAFFTTT